MSSLHFCNLRGSLNRTMRARQQAVEYKIGELLEWYLANNHFTKPTEMCEDSKTYNGKVLRWYEPKPVGAEQNVVLIEEYKGDHWTLRLEPMT